MKQIALLCLSFFITFSTFAQKKLIKRLLSNEIDTTRKPSFMPIPVLGYSQETGFEFGVGALYSTYMDRSDPLNRSSNFSMVGSISTKKQYNLTLRSDIYTAENKYHLMSEFKIRRTPFNFYGIGNNTSELMEDKVLEDQIKILLEAEKSLLPSAYTGISLGFENYKFTDKTLGGLFSTDPAIKGKNGGPVLFVGLSQSYDTRNSNNYPTKGFFGRVTYQYAPNLFSKSDFSVSQIKVKASNFFPVANRLVLGVNGIYNTVQGKNTPFYLLPQMGNDEMMRGYYRGRFREENLLTAQTEIRYRFTNRFGLVAFAGAGQVFENGEFDFKEFKPNLGGGIRYFYDPAKGLSIRLDYGVGEKAPHEKRQSGFYISLAEAF
ncbi:BamA/TamA family outer membrane protein [Pedobacter immunditicola]|uniref:BamA/TamA family outer membrane protein n=1 Tax=Pedobacter immunditicola TaxID=3133440 RepID=UPI0030986A59